MHTGARTYAGKRALDLAVVVIAGGPAAILCALTAALVLLADGRPALYRSTRAGLSGEPFSLLKFRTMRHGADRTPFPDADLVTPLGRLLRRTSLDELPQLWNVLRGDMSLVGPRPTLPYQVERYTERQRGRLAVRPGLTGWAQVRGRNSMPWAERIELDLHYVAEQSLLFDLKVLLFSVKVVLSGAGTGGHPLDDPLAAAHESPPEQH